MTMTVIKLDTDAVLQHMEQVCHALMGQQVYKELRQMITDFACEDASVVQYEQFMELQQNIQQKEQQGIQPSTQEIDQLEHMELKIYENQVIRQFLYARREITKIHDAVSQYFVKAVELNRLPRREELSLKSGCGCGGNCGC